MLQAATKATQAALLQEQKCVGCGHDMPACISAECLTLVQLGLSNV